MADFATLARTRELKLGTYLGEFATPGIGRILKAAGAQFAFVDMEHSGFSFETAKAVLRGLHDAGIATLLRPPTQQAHHLATACDIGAQGIVPPMLSSAREASACVSAVKYAPQGRRGAAFAIAHDNYEPRPIGEAIAAANARTSFVALIETAEGVECCEAIAGTPGVECLWVGHLDLSMSLGRPGEYEHPDFVAAVARVMKAARQAGLSVGRMAGNPREAARLHGEGCDFICYSGDLWLYRQALEEGFSAVKREIGG